MRQGIKTNHKLRRWDLEAWRDEVGYYHRLDGPAVQWWHSGALAGKSWYISGHQYTEIEYWKLIDKLVDLGEIEETVDMLINRISALI